MKKNYSLRKARGLVATVLVLVFVRVPHIWGGEPGISGHNPQTETDSRRELTLSLRIAEVKGNDTVREYVQCLLRQRKRKPIRHDP
jgi:hypothetical protein